MPFTRDGPIVPAARAAMSAEPPVPLESRRTETPPVAVSGPVLAALQHLPWWRLRFPAPVEQVYTRAATHARARRVNVCNLIGSACFWPMTAADVAHAPHIAATVETLRVAVTAWLFAVAFFVLWRGKRDHSWEIDLPTTLSVAAITAYSVVLTRLGGGVMGAITSAGLFAVIMFSAIVVRQDFRHALAVAVGTLVTYALAAADTTGTVRVIADGTVRLLFTAGMFSLFANYMLDRRDRRAYVLRLCEAERQATLNSGVQALQRESHCDPLTGLANRRAFDRAMAQAATAAGSDGHVALLVLDIDHFKRYNDRHGHPAGDACLQAVAAAIDATARAHGGGQAARIGGEEFAVLLPADASASALALADALCAAVRRLALPHPDNDADADGAHVVTVSIGVAATRPGVGREVALLFDAADQALYRAKNTGRNRCVSADGAPAPDPHLIAPPSEAMPATKAANPAPTRGLHGQAQDRPPAPSPAHAPVTADPDTTAPTSGHDHGQDAWMQTLHAALHPPCWRLRFPPALEADYDRAWGHRRGLRLCMLGLLGVVYAVVYQRLARAMLPQLTDAVCGLVEQIAWQVEMPFMLLQLLPMGTWLRESLFGITVLLMGTCFPLLASIRPTIPMQAFAVALFLVPMYSAVIAEQPFRYSLPLSLALFAAATWLMHPTDANSVTAWGICTGLKATATVFALVAGYLLERSTRRNHVLTRLEEAQGGLLQDQSDRLKHLATVDPLTGMANRRLYDAELARLWAQCASTGQPLGLLLLDIDHFKRYNDLYGHPAGDACLRTLADAVRRWADQHGDATGMPRTTSAALAARLGGEEFGVLLPGRNTAQALQAGTALCNEVAALGLVHGDSPTADHVSVSIGVATLAPTLTETGPANGALLTAADAALYRAKAAGRNRACD